MASKGKFATETTVSVEKSLAEIRTLLKRYEAGKFGYIEEDDRVGIGFEMQNRRVRFVMPLPDRADLRVIHGSQYGAYGRERSSSEVETAYERAVRSRWRGLVLTIKAKLESVEVGIESFDEAFMAQLVLPSGETMAEWAAPQIKVAYEQGVMPPLLPSGR